MNLSWDPAREYRCFVDEMSARASIVGSEVLDGARGHVLGDVVFVEHGGVVCDLEITGVSSHQLVDFDGPAAADVLDGSFIVTIDMTAAFRAAYADGWLRVAYASLVDHTWHRLAGSSIYLATSAGVLVALAVEGPVRDPEGSREEQWIGTITRDAPES